MIKIQTKRLLIRDPVFADLNGWHRLKSDAQNMRFVEYLQTRTLEESRADLQKAVDAIEMNPRVKYFFSVVLNETGEFIGAIGFMTEAKEDGLMGGVGWFFLPEHQGKGYATEAFQAMIPFMFNDCAIDIIDAGCKLANPASERIMQKCGMKKIREYEDGTKAQYQLKRQEYFEINQLYCN